MFLGKYLIEFLDENDDTTDLDTAGGEDDGDLYESFLAYLSQMKMPRSDMNALTSEMVIKHAKPVLSQIMSYQDTGDEDERNYLDSSLIKIIIDLAGLDVKQLAPQKSSKKKRFSKEFEF